MENPEAHKRPRGRPAQPEGVRRRRNLTLRIRAETKAALERDAAANGRSLSEEAEMRLDHSFRAEGMLDQVLDLALGRQVAGLTLLLARVMRDTGTLAGFMTKYTLGSASGWLADPDALDLIFRAIAAALDALRPARDVKSAHMSARPSGAILNVNALFETIVRPLVSNILDAVAE